MGEILFNVTNKIAVITIANEHRRNAITNRMEEDLFRYLEEADGSAQVRVVVVTGAGDVAFSSGHDLTEKIERRKEGEASTLTMPTRMRKPTIAAINGHCFAAGLILALSCDLRVASENATFGSPGARLGMLPEGGQIRRLPRLMPASHALEMMLIAEPFSAKRAFELGFLNRLVARGGAVEAAMEMASSIAKNSPAVVAAIKKGVLMSESVPARSIDQFEFEISEDLRSGPDAVEGPKAFLEKREPQFQDS